MKNAVHRPQDPRYSGSLEPGPARPSRVARAQARRMAGRSPRLVVRLGPAYRPNSMVEGVSDTMGEDNENDLRVNVEDMETDDALQVLLNTDLREPDGEE
jgi:hypothetical protein